MEQWAEGREEKVKYQQRRAQHGGLKKERLFAGSERAALAHSSGSRKCSACRRCLSDCQYAARMAPPCSGAAPAA